VVINGFGGVCEKLRSKAYKGEKVERDDAGADSGNRG